MTILTSTMVDHLIGARNRMTDRRDELIDFRAVDHIDAVLSAIPAGDRPDVDALLGREVHPSYIVAQAVTLPEAQAQGDANMAEYAKCQENSKDWKDIKGDLAL